MPETLSPIRPKQMILFEGDSLTNRSMPPCHDTWPFLRLSNWHVTWADRMSEWLFCNRPDLALRFHNSAVGGSNCRGLISRLETCAVAVKPDWIIFTLGNNDQSHKIPLDEFRTTLNKYLDRLAEACGTRPVAIGGFRPCPHVPDAKGKSYALRRPYHRIMRQAAEAHGGMYIDVGAPLQQKARALHRQYEGHTIYSDGGHFNVIGSEIIATTVLDALGLLKV